MRAFISTCLPSFYYSFLPSFLPFFLPSFLSSIHSSFIPLFLYSVLFSFISFFFHYFPSSFIPFYCFLFSCFLSFFLPSFIPSFLGSTSLLFIYTQEYNLNHSIVTHHHHQIDYNTDDIPLKRNTWLTAIHLCITIQLPIKTANNKDRITPEIKCQVHPLLAHRLVAVEQEIHQKQVTVIIQKVSLNLNIFPFFIYF